MMMKGIMPAEHHKAVANSWREEGQEGISLPQVRNSFREGKNYFAPL